MYATLTQNMCATNAVRFSMKTKVNENRLQCAQFSCSLKFLTGLAVMRKSHLRQHFASDCGRKPVNVCVVCKISYDTAADLKTHKVTHTARELVCDKCGKSFDTYNSLRLHSLVHAMDEWFACLYCQKKFRRKTNLRTHMFKHTGLKPFLCECGNRFVTLSKYRAHKRLRPDTCMLVR